MTQTLVILGIVIVVLLLTHRGRETTFGICAAALDQTVRKSGNKERALAMLKERGEVSNADIRKALGVSDRTAVRYMDELEKEGKVEQVGRIGHAVTYHLR